MAEIHRIVAVRGEPLSADRVGVRVRVRLSGCPSVRWSNTLQARLAGDLVGQRAVGHLTRNELVQGDELILEGVETSAVEGLASTLRIAIDATNRAHAQQTEAIAEPTNVPQREADAIARDIGSGAAGADGCE